MTTPRARIDRLERTTARPGGQCPACPAIGYRFTTPPTADELAALAPDDRPPPETCPRCGKPAGAVYVFEVLADWRGMVGV
ncbi:MAG: hypothetical protein ACKVS8_10690 [Phycisphaerales bacterium]